MKLSLKKNTKIYFDYGTETLDIWYEKPQKELDLVLNDLGFRQGENWITKKFEGAEHSERSWQKRINIPIIFLLGSKKP